MSDQPMPVALLDWKAIRKNTLRGFATVRIGRALKVSDVSVHCFDGKRWASLPSKPMVGKDGALQKDDSGKVKYVPVVQWIDQDSRDRFSEAVITAVEREHPHETEE